MQDVLLPPYVATSKLQRLVCSGVRQPRVVPIPPPESLALGFARREAL